MSKKFSGDLIHNLVAGTQYTEEKAVKDTTSSITTDSNTTSSNTTVSDKKMRTSYIISKNLNLKLKYIALKEGRTISDMVEEAFNNLVSEWEKKNGQTPEL